MTEKNFLLSIRKKCTLFGKNLPLTELLKDVFGKMYDNQINTTD